MSISKIKIESLKEILDIDNVTIITSGCGTRKTKHTTICWYQVEPEIRAKEVAS